MRKLSLIATAALLVLGLSGDGIADNPHTDRVILDDVEPGGGLWGAIQNGNGPMRYWLRNPDTVHLLVQPPDPIQPPDPCRGFIIQWNNTVSNSHLSRTKRFDRFTRILRRFEHFGCPVDVTGPTGEEPGLPVIDIGPGVQ